MDPKHREIIRKNIDELVENTCNFENLITVMVKLNVLNKRMVQIINEKENDSDKKREFYNLIPKRGPSAFKSLKEAFYKTQNQHLIDIISSYRMINQTDQHSPIESYNMCSKKRGKVLIINIETFEHGLEKPRLGSLKDVKDLIKLFTDLQFIVESHNNLTHEQFLKVVTNCLNDNLLNEVDCFILIVMSHGEQEASTPECVNILMHDGICAQSRWVYNQMSAKVCPLLINKPKVVMFTTCRKSSRRGTDGVDNSNGIINGNTSNGDPNIVTDSSLLSNPTMTETSFKDILMVYPCGPGEVSYRDTKNGTWFIQHFIKVIRTYSNKEDIETMLKRVDVDISKHATENQLPTQILCRNAYGFRKNFYFYPPIWPLDTTDELDPQ